MKKGKFLLTLAIAVLATVFILSSCSKSNNNDDDNNSNFNSAHYKVENIRSERNGRQLIIYYTVKNISNIDKSVHFNILWKVKGSDGAVYEDYRPAPEVLNAGASVDQTAYINMGTDSNIPLIETLNYKMLGE